MMDRYFVIEDGRVAAALETREEAVELIQNRKKRNTHYIQSDYLIIKGTEEFPKV